jgi:hypothetical protein
VRATGRRPLTATGQLSTLLDLIDALMALSQHRPEAREEAAAAIRRALAVVQVLHINMHFTV